MAEAYPRSSTFASASTITRNRSSGPVRAADAGVADRVRFEVAGAADYPGAGYDPSPCSTRHDMGVTSAGAARHVLSSLTRTAPG
jgi:hypothetical protein